MDKTKVDDMLIEMISPKIKEIEERFSNGQALTQDDINTLLLKSQFNHINHLDLKLNEVTQSVIDLEHKFDLTVVQLRSDYERLEGRVDGAIRDLEGRFEALEQKFYALEGKFEALEDKFDATVKNLEDKFDATVKELRSDYAHLEQRIETTIQKALNKNMMTLIIVIGGFMTLSKIIDKF